MPINYPKFDQKINDYDLIYFDSAATAQMPMQVLNAMNDYYTNYKSNVDRGLYSFD